MEPREFLQDEIRAMVTNCAVCERDARDAEQELGITLDLEAIAHPEDACDYDLIPHQRTPRIARSCAGISHCGRR